VQEWPIQDLYRALFVSARDAVLLCDLETKLFVAANPAACRLLGYSSEELQEKTGRMLSPPCEQAKVDEIYRNIDETGYGHCDDLLIRRGDGSTFWCEARIWVYVSEAPGEPQDGSSSYVEGTSGEAKVGGAVR
jgi:PAS domain S-box-containing protein